MVFERSQKQRAVVDTVQNDGHFILLFSEEKPRIKRHLLIYETKRYSSCRYNERQLMNVTTVRRVRPRAERWYHAYHHPLTNKQIAIQLYY